MIQTNRTGFVYLCIGMLSWMLLCCGDGSTLSKENGAFELKLMNWMDDSGTISAAQLKKTLRSRTLLKLPSLENDSVPVLFIRGSMRSDEVGSVMILEGRFLFSEANVPVKVVVMGSIEGDSAQKRQRLARGVLNDLSDGLRSNIRICNGNTRTWVAALASPEADEQILALELLKMNGEKSAAGKVVSLLDDPRTEVASAAAETASVVADESNVKEIIQIARRGGVEVEARCVEVLSKIGGPESVAFLEMLAVGHENRQMRELSFNALKRLK
ncbi:MAG: hypothetical protein JXX29_09645 [Deltaproteobacteria bacterium]|nr:hypothetical protein [Deltaproteobacteria bacterium]MBN2671928.1 hypothetical protein [Deltaproteobacteria bacterium]